MNRTLYITDLDGTLLNAESRVSPASARLISELTSAGALITCATARTPATVEMLLADTAMTPPAIVMTGAALWDRTSCSYIEVSFIPTDVLHAIMDLCASYGVTPFSYTIHADGIIHAYYHGRPGKKERQFIDERSRLRLKRMHIIERPAVRIAPVYADTALVFALGPLTHITALADALKAMDICSVSCYPDIFNHSTGYIEIFAHGVSKASAVAKMKERMGADRLVVFGDNLNDLPMMAVADTAVAVANALPEVRQAAHTVIGPNTADAVARFIAADLQK
ncbi:MAG: Cof-type HAD-IIB family hydrolase [Bacteroides sp.]|nr:Cof-type HAD-IIB family hydrolase [Bacteroides sp.]MCM1413631.1 Cof-type HAD-IIB family hydrolase [Bacteroides sp.]MCM1471152.1 Cof-type HAD-IIB family hydrolase [Bacteroides sp.]